MAGSLPSISFLLHEFHILSIHDRNWVRLGWLVGWLVFFALRFLAFRFFGFPSQAGDGFSVGVLFGLLFAFCFTFSSWSLEVYKTKRGGAGKGGWRAKAVGIRSAGGYGFRNVVSALGGRWFYRDGRAEIGYARLGDDFLMPFSTREWDHDMTHSMRGGCVVGISENLLRVFFLSLFPCLATPSPRR